MGLFSDLANAIRRAQQDGADVAQSVLEQVLAHPEVIAFGPPVLGVSESADLLTREQAMVDTIRALKECYPDRWERVWDALHPSRDDLAEMLERITAAAHYERLRANLSPSDFATDLRAELRKTR